MVASMIDITAYLPLAGSILGLLCLWGAMKANWKRRLVQDTPTSKTTGVFIGFVELQGTAEAETPFISYLAETPCVLYSWNVSERWSRTVTEHYTDSQGRRQTRTRHESGWTTVASGGETRPFYLRDDHGIVLVHPDGAQLEPACVFDQTCGRSDPLYYQRGPAMAVSNSDHRRRFVENVIQLHQPVYVCGQARLREDIVAPEIAKHPDAPLFLISVRGEDEICSSYGWKTYGWWAAGIVLFAGGWAFLAYSQAAGADPLTWILPALTAAGVFGLFTSLGWVWMVFDSLIRLRQRVRQGWSLIDVQLKRRHDLIPSLAAIVTGLKAYEQEVQTALAELRAQSGTPDPAASGDRLQALAPRLYAVAEAYPELKANESFQKLQQELIDTENRIALARSYYNEIATYYNSRLQVLPEKFVADMVSMKPHVLIEAENFERAPVNVHLTGADDNL